MTLTDQDALVMGADPPEPMPDSDDDCEEKDSQSLEDVNVTINGDDSGNHGKRSTSISRDPPGQTMPVISTAKRKGDESTKNVTVPRTTTTKSTSVPTKNQPAINSADAPEAPATIPIKYHENVPQNNNNVRDGIENGINGNYDSLGMGDASSAVTFTTSGNTEKTTKTLKVYAIIVTVLLIALLAGLVGFLIGQQRNDEQNAFGDYSSVSVRYNSDLTIEVPVSNTRYRKNKRFRSLVQSNVFSTNQEQEQQKEEQDETRHFELMQMQSDEDAGNSTNDSNNNNNTMNGNGNGAQNSNSDHSDHHEAPAVNDMNTTESSAQESQSSNQNHEDDHNHGHNSNGGGGGDSNGQQTTVPIYADQAKADTVLRQLSFIPSYCDILWTSYTLRTCLLNAMLKDLNPNLGYDISIYLETIDGVTIFPAPPASTTIINNNHDLKNNNDEERQDIRNFCQEEASYRNQRKHRDLQSYNEYNENDNNNDKREEEVLPVVEQQQEIAKSTTMTTTQRKLTTNFPTQSPVWSGGEYGSSSSASPSPSLYYAYVNPDDDGLYNNATAPVDDHHTDSSSGSDHTHGHGHGGGRPMTVRFTITVTVPCRRNADNPNIPSKYHSLCRTSPSSANIVPDEAYDIQSQLHDYVRISLADTITTEGLSYCIFDTATSTDSSFLLSPSSSFIPIYFPPPRDNTWKTYSPNVATVLYND